MHADMRIRCSDDGYSSADWEHLKVLSSIFIVLWPAGIPLTFGVLLAEVLDVHVAEHVLGDVVDLGTAMRTYS